MKTEVMVSDALTRDPLIISPNSNVKDVALIMKNDKVSSLIVMEHTKLKGIVNAHDMVRKVIAEGLDHKTKVKEIMTTNLLTIDSKADLYDAMVLMRDNAIRQLPVVDGGKLVGLLTHKDVLKIQPGLFEILTEKFRLRNDMGKSFGERYVDGECAECGAFDQLFEMNGRWVCSHCR